MLYLLQNHTTLISIIISIRRSTESQNIVTVIDNLNRAVTELLADFHLKEFTGKQVHDVYRN